MPFLIPSFPPPFAAVSANTIFLQMSQLIIVHGIVIVLSLTHVSIAICINVLYVNCFALTGF